MKPLQFSFEPQFGKHKMKYLPSFTCQILQKRLLCVPQKNIIRVWNNMRVSKWWQNFHLWVNCPFKNIKERPARPFGKKSGFYLSPLTLSIGENGKSSHGTLGHTPVLPYISAVSSNKSFHNKHTGRTKAIQNSGIVYTSPEEHHLNMDGTNCTHPGEDGE